MKLTIHWDPEDKWKILGVEGKQKVMYEKLPELVRKAVDTATEAHRGQYRKDKKTSYISHPWSVLYIAIVCEWNFTDEELAAFVLHDVVEDTIWPYKVAIVSEESKRITQFKKLLDIFGPETTSIVYLLTKPLGEKYRQIIYKTALRRVAPSVIAGKLADALHNLMDLPEGMITDKSKKRCIECNGSGSVKTDNEFCDKAKCSECEGTGYVSDTFANYFRQKVHNDVLPLIDILRMHGQQWQNVANWFETRIRRLL